MKKKKKMYKVEFTIYKKDQDVYDTNFYDRLTKKQANKKFKFIKNVGFALLNDIEDGTKELVKLDDPKFYRLESIPSGIIFEVKMNIM